MANDDDDKYLERITSENQTKKKIKDFEEEIKKASIGHQERIAKREIEGQRKKEDTKRKIIGMTIGGIGTLLVLGSIRLGIDLHDRITFHNDLEKASSIICDDILETLESEGIDNENINYKELDSDISNRELYGFYQILGSEESEEIVQIMAPIDENYYDNYTGWKSFCSRNGYFNEDGDPSISVWKNYTESEIVEAYRNGTLLEEEGRSK